MDGVQDKGENEDSSSHKLTSPTNEDNNDPGSECGNDTTPPGTPDLIRQQRLEDERKNTNNTPPSIIITDQADCFDESVFTNVTDIDETSNQ
eukprot:4326850-Ditylum_brightwellii.AAC.1